VDLEIQIYTTHTASLDYTFYGMHVLKLEMKLINMVKWTDRQILTVPLAYKAWDIMGE